MLIKQIMVLKETRPHEGRVALIPADVKLLRNKNYTVMVETQAGSLSGFSDEEYLQQGARIFKMDGTKFLPHSLFLRVKRPSKERELLEAKLFSSNSLMIGFLDPLDKVADNYVAHLRSRDVQTISLELLPLSAEDPKNAQAAMSRFAGALALEDALNRYKGPDPKKVTVIGTGPAGLSAAEAAIKRNLPVQLFGRQERYRKIMEELGIQYYLMPVTNQIEYLCSYLHNQTIIITAARNVGQNSPLLIDTHSMGHIPDSAVIIDLSSGEGGNVIGSKQDTVIPFERGITVVNVSGYPKLVPRRASEAYSNCMVNLLDEILNGEIDFKNKLLLNQFLPTLFK